MPTPKRTSRPAAPAARTAAPRRRRPREKPEDADTLAIRAMRLIKRGQHAEAAETFLLASKLEPTNWRLPNDAGESFFLAGRYVDALRCFSAATMMMPDMSTVLFNRGLAQAMLEQEADAFVTFQHVLELDGTHAGAYLEIGRLHALAGRHWDAIEAFDAALSRPAVHPRVVSAALREKALLLLGPLQCEPEGIAVVQSMWEQFRDSAAVLALAKDLLDSTKPRVARVLDVVLADVPADKKVLALRARITRPS